MNRQRSLVTHLLDAFPPRRFHGNVTSHNCAECPEIRAALDDASWWSIPGELIRRHADHLPLLTRDAYIAFLPAWLRAAVEEPAGNVARVVLAELHKPEVASCFSRQQAYAVIQVARHLTQDPALRGMFDNIERVWNGQGG